MYSKYVVSCIILAVLLTVLPQVVSQSFDPQYRIAYIFTDDYFGSDRNANHLVFIDPDGSNRVVIDAEGSSFKKIEWSPDHERLMVLRGRSIFNGYNSPDDQQRLEFYDPDGELVWTFVATGAINDAAWVSNEEFVFTGEESILMSSYEFVGSTLWGYNIPSNDQYLIAEGSMSYDSANVRLAVSPNGEMIAISHLTSISIGSYGSFIVLIEYDKDNFPYGPLDFENAEISGYTMLLDGTVENFTNYFGKMWWSADSTFIVTTNQHEYSTANPAVRVNVDVGRGVDLESACIADYDHGFHLFRGIDVAHTSDHYLCAWGDSLYDIDPDGYIRTIRREGANFPTWSEDDSLIVYERWLVIVGENFQNRLVVVTANGEQISEFPISLVTKRNTGNITEPIYPDLIDLDW